MTSKVYLYLEAISDRINSFDLYDIDFNFYKKYLNDASESEIDDVLTIRNMSSKIKSYIDLEDYVYLYLNIIISTLNIEKNPKYLFIIFDRLLEYIKYNPNKNSLNILPYVEPDKENYGDIELTFIEFQKITSKYNKEIIRKIENYFKTILFLTKDKYNHEKIHFALQKHFPFTLEFLQENRDILSFRFLKENPSILYYLEKSKFVFTELLKDELKLEIDYLNVLLPNNKKMNAEELFKNKINNETWSSLVLMETLNEERNN